MNPSRGSTRTTSAAAGSSGSCISPSLQETFPEALADVDAEAFYRAVNQVRPGKIRVEADELTYDFHIMLRVEIEKRLVDGKPRGQGPAGGLERDDQASSSASRSRRRRGRAAGHPLVDLPDRHLLQLHHRQRHGGAADGDGAEDGAGGRRRGLRRATMRR